MNMNTKDFKEMPYTIEIDWETGNVWLNIHTSQEKIVITKKDLNSIKRGFDVFNIKNSK